MNRKFDSLLKGMGGILTAVLIIVIAVLYLGALFVAGAILGIAAIAIYLVIKVRMSFNKAKSSVDSNEVVMVDCSYEEVDQ